MKTYQIKINPANLPAIREIKKEFSPVMNKNGYYEIFCTDETATDFCEIFGCEIVEGNGTTVEQMEKWLTDNDFFVGGLNDTQIEFYYNKLK